MARVSLNVDDEIVAEINVYLTAINNDVRQNASANDIAREALAVYRWVAKQIFEGRAVVAVNKDMDAHTQIATEMIPAKPPRI